MNAPALGGGVAAVILAAGSSSRLGTPKQLLRYRGETLLHRTVRLALAAGLDPVHVVLGCNASAVGAALEELRARVATVINPDWQTGMGSSLVRGIVSLPGVGTATLPTGDESVRSLRDMEDDENRCPSIAHQPAISDQGTRRELGAGPRPGSETGADAPTACELGAVLVLVTDQPRVSHALLAEIAAAFRTGGAPLVASRYAGGALGVPALFARRYFPELTRLTGDRGARALFNRYRDDLTTVAFPEGGLDIDTPAAAASLQSE